MQFLQIRKCYEEIGRNDRHHRTRCHVEMLYFRLWWIDAKVQLGRRCGVELIVNDALVIDHIATIHVHTEADGMAHACWQQ